MRSRVDLPQPEAPKQREDLAFADAEADIVDGYKAVEFLADAFDADVILGFGLLRLGMRRCYGLGDLIHSV